MITDRVIALLSSTVLTVSLAAQQPTAPWAEQKTDYWIAPLKPDHRQMAPTLPAAAAPVPSAGADLPSPPVISNQFATCVLFDRRDDEVWALGHTYKACFGPEAVTYVPYFGAHAPRNHPVRFTFVSAQLGNQVMPAMQPREVLRDANRVTLDRGVCREVYDLQLRQIEQSFVFPHPESQGELTVTLEVETDLDLVAASDGIEFRGALGSVWYREAVAFDASGTRSPVTIAGEGRRIRLSVPAAFVAKATGTITIDPMLATFTTSMGTPFDFHSDVAAMTLAMTGVVTAVTWERIFSSSDHDVFVQWHSAPGVTMGPALTIDFTAENWVQPRIATDQATATALVVAQVGQPWGQRIVKGRVASTTTTTTAAFQISGSEGGEAVNPDIGGNPSGAAGTAYCVVWERAFSASDRDILFQMVSAAGVRLFAGSLSVDNSLNSFDTRPRIGKTCGTVSAIAGQFWPVVWQRRFSATDEDIRGAAITPAASLSLASFSVDFSGASDTSPVVSAPTLPLGTSRRFLVAYERQLSTVNHDVIGRVFSTATSLTGAVDLSQLEDAASASAMDQVTPSVATDDTRFYLASIERDGNNVTGSNRLFVSALSVGLDNVVRLIEGRRPVTTGVLAPELAPSLAALPGLTRMAITFETVNTPTTDRDVRGALYDGSLGRLPSTMPGCPLSIFAFPLGAPVAQTPGSTMSIAFVHSSHFLIGSATLFVGPALAIPAPFCPVCALGVDLNRAVAMPIALGFGGNVTVTVGVPADPAFIGTTFAAQVLAYAVQYQPLSPYTTCLDRPLTLSDCVLIPIN